MRKNRSDQSGRADCNNLFTVNKMTVTGNVLTLNAAVEYEAAALISHMGNVKYRKLFLYILVSHLGK